MASYNTYLAGEFYVLSMLHRLGADATLTLGNKKSVDIVVIPTVGIPVTVDVKTLAGKTGWPVDNFRGSKERHFLALVCFLDRIADPTQAPEVYIVPSEEAATLIYKAPGGRKLIRLSNMQNNGKKYQNAWNPLL